MRNKAFRRTGKRAKSVLYWVGLPFPSLKTMPIISPSPETLKQAADALRAGKLVAFPTETVYGLGGDATNERAVAAIYAAKGRPQFNPLIAHLAGAQEAARYVAWNERAQKLADAFWPGPLTLVLPRAKDSKIALLASAGLDTIAVRVPDHPVARELIRLSGLPVAAPSANASGRLSPTRAAHVADSLGDKVDWILDGGPCAIGVESTVLDLSGERPALLRPGGITKERIEALLGPIEESLKDPDAPKSPGMLESHYAPHLPVRLNATEAGDDEAFLTFGPDQQLKGGAFRINLSPGGDLLEAAANLFAMLRALDLPDFKGIAVMPIPDEGLGAAINDRLRRAAAPRPPKIG